MSSSSEAVGYSDHRPKSPDYLAQPIGDLAEGTVFHRANQFFEDVSLSFNHLGQPVKAPDGFASVALLEIMQSVLLKLLLFLGRSNHMDLGPVSIRIAVSVQTDDWSDPIVDLALQQMAGCLDLAALVSPLNRTDDSALLFYFTEFVQDRFFHGATDRFHSGRTR